MTKQIFSSVLVVPALMAMAFSMLTLQGAMASHIRTLDVPQQGGFLLGANGEHPDASSYRGQTFKPLNTRLVSLDYRLRMNTPFPDDDAPVSWRLLITETTGTGSSIQPTNVLFESERMTHDSLAVTNFHHDIPAVPMDLTKTYAWILDTYAEWDGVLDAMDNAVNTLDPYPDGHIIMSYQWGSTDSRAAHFTSNWDDFIPSYDLAFTAVFIPEPCSLHLVGLVAIWLASVRRRRR